MMKNSVLKQKLISLYEMFYECRRIFILRTKYHLKIMSTDQTIRYIDKQQCSIARFGDGEFDLIGKKRDLLFQPLNNELSNCLESVLKNKNPDLLVCIPGCLNSVKGCNDHAKEFWINWGRKNNHHQEIVKMVRSNAGQGYLYGDSQITRPYIDWRNAKRARRTFPKMMKLWKNKDILIIEGEQTRLGVENNLFDGAASIKRILAPAIGAFERHKEIKQCVLEHYQGELLILALGPTATVLAAEFADLQIQALDIGNIDIEYEWFLRGAKERVPIPGKFTNEAKDGRNYSECDNETYLGQIIAKIGC